MTLSVTFTNAARQDLEGLYDYTVTTWGQQQAELYVDSLRSTITTLDAKRALWRAMPEWRTSGYRVKFRHHYVFFVVSQTELLVARVLHERRDVLRYLIEQDDRS